MARTTAEEGHGSSSELNVPPICVAGGTGASSVPTVDIAFGGCHIACFASFYARARNMREKTRYTSYFGTKQTDWQIVVCSYTVLFRATLVATGSEKRWVENTNAVWKNTNAVWKNTNAVWKKTNAVWKNTHAVLKNTHAVWKKTHAVWEIRTPFGTVATEVARKSVL